MRVRGGSCGQELDISCASQCKWRSKRVRGFEFHSDDGQSSRDNEVVTLGRTPDSSADNMCYFTINTVSYDHDGDWECVLYAECEAGAGDTGREEDGFSRVRGRNTEAELLARRRRQTMNRRCPVSIHSIYIVSTVSKIST